MKILMCGYGYSGSTAFNDLLQEFDNVIELGDELRFLVDPDGLIATEVLLKQAWNPFVTDQAIRRLKEMLERLGTHKSYPYYNQNHNRNISNLFSEAVDEFLTKLCDIRFEGMWLGINDPWEYRRRHIKTWTRGLFDRDYKKPMFFSSPDKDFVQLGREFICKILEPYTGKHILLDEGYASLNPAAALKYIEDGKMLISVRDPRDVYCEIVRKNARFIPHEVEKFILWYKGVRQQNIFMSQEAKDVLSVRFEDIILDYDKTLKQITDFLGLDPSTHSRKRTLLVPERSAANVGKWKNYTDQEIMQKIGVELQDYIYN